MMIIKNVIEMLSPKGFHEIEGLVDEINYQSREAVKSLEVNGKPLKGLKRSRKDIHL